MVPVRLQLRNFLSYGDAAEALDFEQFHVACLSGGNGQGKSALLDAITWALWGEARKSAEARKPDEELLRIGAREMEVDLEFDLEGARYRVVRSFYRTASGKTTKAGLEFQVNDAGQGGWRALTDTTVPKTQEVINRTLRLDYDTFINSAFLLQGRSDEFTKKKPTERKQILARILGLDRFDRLQKAASARYAEADARCKAAGTEEDRLKEALQDEPALREDLAAVEADLAARQGELTRLRAEEATLAERLTRLDTRARQAEGARQQLDQLLETARDRHEQQHQLAQRIADADELLAQADRIRQDYERHQALTAETRQLDEKRNQLTGLNEQLGALREQLRQKQQEQRDRLTRLEAELSNHRRELGEKQPRLIELEPTKKALEAARQAEREANALRARLDERRRLEQRLDALDKQLAHARGALQTRIDQGRLRIQELERTLAERPALQERCTALARREEQARSLEAAQVEVREQGTELAGRIQGIEHDIERLSAEQTAIDEKAAQLDALETENCPTCGTALTEEHRQAVHQTYAEERAALERRVERQRAERSRLEAERQKLRERYRALDQEISGLRSDREEQARIIARLREADAAEEQVKDLRAQLVELGDQLAQDRFEPAVQAQRTEVSEQLLAETVDEAAYQQALQRAAGRQALEATVRDLLEASARVETLRELIARQDRDLVQLREALAGGGGFEALTEQIAVLQQRAEGLEYSAAHHDGLLRQLAALDGAPGRHHDLLSARERVVEWKELRQRFAEEEAHARKGAEALRVQAEAAEQELAERPALQVRKGELERTCAEAEHGLHEAQARRGALSARLDRCARDREALLETRRTHKEARHDRSVWAKLRKAFGKSGIPALIIEETLPEVEERANLLLDRLSGGRTRVHLETLRDNKSGGTRETLDIRITDDQGASRSYETFSGGEAFRVNFALRIALAQLLAERAGVRVRTLVVDEGFGTQDKEGIESLVGAIQAIREDFEKVLVITHLDELKEAFPVRIEVRKHPVEGSRYDVIGV